MKKLALIIAVLLLVGIVYTPSQAFDMINKLGVGVDGGIMLPISGNVTADSTVSDYFKAGPSFGFHVKYNVIKEVGIQAGFNYAFMQMEDAIVKDSSAPDPYINMPQIYLEGILNMGSFFNDNNPNNIWNPFITAGVGLYPWKITTDGVNGDAQLLSNNEELKKTSFGINFGGGLEVFATPKISFFAQGKYHYIFTSDSDTFGADLPDFDDTGYLEFTGGMTYYFPLTSTK